MKSTLSMTPDQCRAARERLNWTRDELGKAADVPLWFVAAFEDGKETPGFLVCWEMAIEAALGDAPRAVFVDGVNLHMLKEAE